MEKELKETNPLSTPGNIDRRKHPRFPVHLRVEYQRANHARTHAGQVIDISESGLMLNLSERAEVGQNLSLRMFIGSGISKSIEAGVRVVWRQFIKGSGYRIGGKFIDISSEEKIKLEFLLRHLMKPKTRQGVSHFPRLL
jgi:hypothetical protein